MKGSQDTDVLVIGAGIVGSWAALHALERGYSVVICDPSPGDGVSGRNSGVLHAGLYYSHNPLKAKHCVRGKRLTEEFVDRHGLPILRCGKIVTSGRSGSPESIDRLYHHAQLNGASDIELMDNPGSVFPGVVGSRALLSKGTSVLDVAAYLKCLHFAIEEAGGILLRGRRFNDGNPERCELSDLTGMTESISAGLIINAAGLVAHEIAARAGISGYELFPMRGEYYRLRRKFPLNLLVYPLPASMRGSTSDTALGVHYTVHPSGEVYIGPNAVPAANSHDYSISQSAEQFAESLSEIIGDNDGSLIGPEDLAPGYAGIRPRLIHNGEPVLDFVLEESEPGFFHFLGIESPGLTSAPSLVSELPL